MTNLFTKNVLKAALASAVLLTSGTQSFAKGNLFSHITGKNHSVSGTNKAPKVRNGQHARTNTVISRPGNSQDFEATGTGSWQHESNSAYTYDTQGRLTQRLYTDPATAQNMRRDIILYDAQGNEIEYRTEEWLSGIWVIMDAYKSVITYSTQGLKTEIIYQSWDGNSNQWETEGREQYAYDTNNLVTSITSSEWKNNTWNFTERLALSNINGTATSLIVQEYNGVTWDDIYRAQNITWHTLYEIPSAYTFQYYDSGIWVNEEKYAAVYDANGGYIGIYEAWDAVTNIWVKDSRETESYDVNKNYTGFLNENWNPVNSTWVFSSEDREVLTYAGINVTQRIFQDSYNQNNILEDTRKEVYSNFQTFTISGLKPTAAEIAVNIYPNPAANYINIDSPATNGSILTATVSDVTGKTWLIKTFKAGEETTLNIETLPKRIYLLQLQTETGSTVKRIVKQ